MTDKTGETPAMLAAEFRDCDQYYEAIKDVDVRFTLQGLETSIWRICSLPLPRGIHIQCCWSGSGSLAQGVSRKGGFELAVPATGEYTANGQSVPVESLLFMVPGSEFLVSIPRSHSWFGVFVPETLAVSIGLPTDSKGRMRGDTQVLHRAAPAQCSLPSLLTRFFAMAHGAPEITRSVDALGQFEAELLYVLGTAYGHLPEPSTRRAGRPAVVDHISVNRALDAIEASAESTMAMSELVEVTNASERALRAGFRKYLDMSPTRYMRLRTLNRARRRLAASEPGETSVAEVAADLGVWDLGRFAARYRGLYGELPSSTLRNTI